jgi:hypothetical protein
LVVVSAYDLLVFSMCVPRDRRTFTLTLAGKEKKEIETAF